MTDLERVLQGLDCVSGFGHCLQSEAFAGGICAYCIKEIAKKAKELLKEQEPQKQNNNACPRCGWDFINGDLDFSYLDSTRFYCPNCGQAVKWE